MCVERCEPRTLGVTSRSGPRIGHHRRRRGSQAGRRLWLVEEAGCVRPRDNTWRCTLIVRWSKLPTRSCDFCFKTCETFTSEAANLPHDCSLISATRAIQSCEDPVALWEIEEVVLVGVT